MTLKIGYCFTFGALKVHIGHFSMETLLWLINPGKAKNKKDTTMSQFIDENKFEILWSKFFWGIK